MQCTVACNGAQGTLRASRRAAPIVCAAPPATRLGHLCTPLPTNASPLWAQHQAATRTRKAWVRSAMAAQPALASGAHPASAAAAALLAPAPPQAPTLWQRLAQYLTRGAVMLGMALAIALGSAGTAEAARSGGRMGGSAFSGGSRSYGGGGFSSGGSSFGGSRSFGGGSSFGGSKSFGGGSSYKGSSSMFGGSSSSSSTTTTTLGGGSMFGGGSLFGGGSGSSSRLGSYRSSSSSAPLSGGFSSGGSAHAPATSVQTNAFFLSPFGAPASLPACPAIALLFCPPVRPALTFSLVVL